MNPSGVTRWASTTAMNLPGPQSECPRQDADFQKPFSFTKQGECVLDNNTGLTWEVKIPQNMNDTFTWYQTIGGVGVGVANGGSTGLDTEKYVAQVNAAKLGDYSDWRLPTIKELESIVDFSRINPPIDPEYFPNSPTALFWTSTPDVMYQLGAFIWFVDFMTGNVGREQPMHPHAVRLVRGAPLVIHQFTITDNGLTVTDTSTALMWKRGFEVRDPANPGDWQNRIDTFQWQEALQRAVADSTGGHTDWRLPNIKELHSLVDETLRNPAIDTNVFPPTPFQSTFWSSSTVLDFFGSQDMSWPVSFDAGGEVASPRYFTFWVRLVRNIEVNPMDYTESEVLTWFANVNMVAHSAGIDYWRIKANGGQRSFLGTVRDVTVTTCNKLLAELP